jgi:tetratricopeptide (TPR) repeat protein
LRARAAWHLRRAGDAERFAGAAIAAAEGPSDAVAHAWRILGVVALNAGAPDAADLLGRAVAAAATPAVRARAHYVLGSLHYRRLQLDAAEAAYSLARDEGAGHPNVVSDAEAQLAELRRIRGDPEGALTHAARAVAALGSEHGPLALLRALAQRSAGRPREGIAACAESVALYLARGIRPPYHPWLCEGLCWLDLGDLPAARAALERSLERATVSRRRTAAAGLHAFLLSPTAALGDWAAAAVHLAAALDGLLGAGEGDPDLDRGIADFIRRAREAGRDDLAERAIPLWVEQRRLVAG